MKVRIPVVTFLFVLLAAILTKPQSAAAAGTLFDPYYHTYGGIQANAVGLGDFNHDGLPDVAMATGGEVFIYHQNASRLLDNPSIAYVGARAESIAIGDLNGDGWADIATGNFGDNNVSVLLQTASGMSAPTLYPANTGPDSVAIGDVNNDGRSDLVISHWNSPTIGVRLQQSNGTLGAMTAYAAPSAGYDEIEVADVNGDGRQDVIRANGQGSGPQIAIYYQNAGGTLNAYVGLNAAGVTRKPKGIATDDLNGDGRTDLIATYSYIGTIRGLVVFLQDAAGSLGTGTTYTYTANIGGTAAVDTADVNGDGLKDIVSTRDGGGMVVFLQQAGGGFVASDWYGGDPGDYASSFKPQGLAVGDINNDALPDAVLANYNFGLEVLNHNNPTNPAPTPTPPPVPSDVLFGAAAYVDYGADSSQAVGAGDFNGDGRGDAAVSVDKWGTTTDELRVYYQQPGGGLAQATFTVGSRPQSLAVGDVNGDSRDDIAVANFGSNTITVFTQTAAGGLSVSSVTTLMGPDSVQISDVTGDGRQDLVVSHWNAPNIRVYPQLSGGGLGAGINYASEAAGYDDLALGDVTGDGRNDVVKMNGQGSVNPNLVVYRQNTSGTLDARVPYEITGDATTPNAVEIGDLNGDGVNEVLVAIGGNVPGSGIGIFKQNGSGGLVLANMLAAWHLPDTAELADVNADGRLDVILAHSYDGKVTVYLQKEDGTLHPFQTYSGVNHTGFGSASMQPQALAVGDVTGDGKPDLLLADPPVGLVILTHN